MTLSILTLVLLVLNNDYPDVVSQVDGSDDPISSFHHYDELINDTALHLSVTENQLPDEISKVAIIIDDFGPPGTVRLLDGFLNLGIDHTWSVIPGNLKSSYISAKADESGQEVFIHLPLEPTDEVAMDERDMILCTMEQDTVRAILHRAILDIPNAVGLNNHMGSKATVNTRIMSVLSSELAEMGLIFVDSQTAPKSVAHVEMINSGVPSLKRDIFLDNARDSTQIAMQYHKLIRIARIRGWAIGIGHAREQTLELLKILTPKSVEEGIRFVSAGELIKEVIGNSDMKFANKSDGAG